VPLGSTPVQPFTSFSVFEFKGAGKSFSTNPFMLTFDIIDPEKDVKGWTGVDPKGTPKGKGGGAKSKAPAPKGK